MVAKCTRASGLDPNGTSSKQWDKHPLCCRSSAFFLCNAPCDIIRHACSLRANWNEVCALHHPGLTHWPTRLAAVCRWIYGIIHYSIDTFAVSLCLCVNNSICKIHAHAGDNMAAGLWRITREDKSRTIARYAINLKTNSSQSYRSQVNIIRLLACSFYERKISGRSGRRFNVCVRVVHQVHNHNNQQETTQRTTRHDTITKP